MLMTELGLSYAENEAAYVLWDEVQEADCSMCKSIEPFKEY